MCIGEQHCAGAVCRRESRIRGRAGRGQYGLPVRFRNDAAIIGIEGEKVGPERPAYGRGTIGEGVIEYVRALDHLELVQRKAVRLGDDGRDVADRRGRRTGRSNDLPGVVRERGNDAEDVGLVLLAELIE